MNFAALRALPTAMLAAGMLGVDTAGAGEVEGGDAIADAWRFESVSGEVVAPFASPETEALVVVFIATDCPIANYFQPTLRRLSAEFGREGMALVMVHADPSVTAEDARAHRAEFAIEAPVVLDPEFAVARRLAAKVTPEAFVIDREGAVRYRGRIDDTYADFGKKRPRPRHRDLRDAVAAVLGGREVSTTKTKPVGCYIPYPTVPTSPTE